MTHPFTCVPSDETHRHAEVCIECGSAVSWNAYVMWDCDEQNYVHDDYRDHPYCSQCDDDKADTTYVYPPPRSLDELRDYINQGIVWFDAPLIQGVIDTTALPTFGGPRAPKASDPHVWSWDETYYLIGTPSSATRTVGKRDRITFDKYWRKSP